jgi:o-succinylbenzoate synthase
MGVVKIHSLDIYQYSLPFKEPLNVHEQELTKREGLFVHLKSDQDAEAFGEIAPLPGFSQENFKEVLKQTKSLRSSLPDQSIPDRIEELDGKFENWLKEYHLKPSVRFGIEMAVLNLLANFKKMPLFQLLSASYHNQIRINGLLQGSKRKVTRQAAMLIQDGYTALKLKLGGDIDEDIDKVRSVNDVINGRALLHLDVNQAWDLNKAIKFGNEVGLAAVNYIEEPLKDITLIPEFFMKTTIPVALDESLLNLKIEDVKSISGVYTLVLKPMILGGIEKTWQIIAQTKKLGINTVISSSFETGIGILTLANLAGCSLRETAAGLDTLKYFEQDIFKVKLPIIKGRIDIRQRKNCSRDINFEILKKIK